MPSLPLLLPKIDLADTNYCCSTEALDTSLDHAKDHHVFSLQAVAWAIQSGLSIRSVERYLQKYDPANGARSLRESIISSVTEKELSIPILFFAIERNVPELVRTLCNVGAQVDCQILPYNITAIAHAVLSAEYEVTDTTDITITLLAMGASPHGIPHDMWEEPLKAAQKEVQESAKDRQNQWCTAEIWEALSRTLNLMQRYSLWNALNIKSQSLRDLQEARTNSFVPIFEAPFHMIGQGGATQMVLKSIINYYRLGQQSPLILLFTGLSGHGKTELAKRMEYLLSLKMLSVDCTTMERETDIFGPKAPYCGYEKGSPLNNHLADYAGQRSVVFLDEFDKTTDEVRKSMLLLFEAGKYYDRRDNSKELDCSKVIWILAANIGVETISRFWERRLKTLTNRDMFAHLFSELEKVVHLEVARTLRYEVAGRISLTIPFVPFNELEQAVAAFKFMRKQRNHARQPIDVKAKHFFRHCNISYSDDGGIASFVAQQSYVRELGARSLENGVTYSIMWKVPDAFGEGEAEISDVMNDGPLKEYHVGLVTTDDGSTSINVGKVGVPPVQRRWDD